MKEITVDLTPLDDRPKARDAEPPAGTIGPDSAASAPDGAEGAAVVVDVPPEAAEEQVRGMLRMIGKIAHRAKGDKRFPEHWSFTTDELDDLAPPATAIVNRSLWLRRAVAQSDYMQLAVGLFGWGSRNAELSEQIEAVEAEYAEADDVAAPTAEAEGADAALLGPLYSGGA